MRGLGLSFVFHCGVRQLIIVSATTKNYPKQEVELSNRNSDATGQVVVTSCKNISSNLNWSLRSLTTGRVSGETSFHHFDRKIMDAPLARELLRIKNGATKVE